MLEQIVGEIEDEHDHDEDLNMRHEAVVRAGSMTEIDDFNEEFGTNFSDDEFDTIGGLSRVHWPSPSAWRDNHARPSNFIVLNAIIDGSACLKSAKWV